jgi:predicted PP-loop superfamily ATPase
MARTKGGVNKSEEIRQLLKANPKITAKETVAAMEEKGLEISENLYYFIKGKMKGRRGRKKKANKMVASVTASTGGNRSSAVSTILKVKALADEVGGLKNLKALVEALGS